MDTTTFLPLARKDLTFLAHLVRGRHPAAGGFHAEDDRLDVPVVGDGGAELVEFRGGPAVDDARHPVQGDGLVGPAGLEGHRLHRPGILQIRGEVAEQGHVDADGGRQPQAEQDQQENRPAWRPPEGPSRGCGCRREWRGGREVAAVERRAALGRR